MALTSQQVEHILDEALRSDGGVADLANKFLGDEWCPALVEALDATKHKGRVDLRGNNIRADGASVLADFLKRDSRIVALTLEWNAIGLFDHGVRSLASALEVNSCLAELDLRNNSIGPEGGTAIARALRRNRTLQRIDLRWNSIGESGVRAILAALDENSALVEIALAGNRAPDALLRAVEAKLAHRGGGGSSPRKQQQALDDDSLEHEAEEAQVVAVDVNLLAAREERLRQEYESTRLQLQSSAEAVNALEAALRDERARASQLDTDLGAATTSNADLRHRLDQAQTALSQCEGQTEASLRALRAQYVTACEERASLEKERTLRREAELAGELRQQEAIQERDATNKQLQDQVFDLTSRLRHCEVRLAAAEEESRQLKDQAVRTQGAAERERATSREQQEDQRRALEARLANATADAERRVSAAEGRAQAADLARQAAEDKAEALRLELARVRVDVEERCAQSADSTRAEAHAQHAAAIAELESRIAGLQDSRDQLQERATDTAKALQAAQERVAERAREHEDLLADVKKELQEARQRAQDAELEASRGRSARIAAERQHEIAVRSAEEAQASVAQLKSAHGDHVAELGASHERERATWEAQAEERASRVALLEEELSAATLELSRLRHNQEHAFTEVESRLARYVQQTFAEARLLKSPTRKARFSVTVPGSPPASSSLSVST